MHHAFRHAEHLEPEMIVRNPSVDGFVTIQLEGFRRFPGAVDDAEVDVSCLCTTLTLMDISNGSRRNRNDVCFYLRVQSVDMLLDLDGLGQRRDDAAVVLDIVCG